MIEPRTPCGAIPQWTDRLTNRLLFVARLCSGRHFYTSLFDGLETTHSFFIPSSEGNNDSYGSRIRYSSDVRSRFSLRRKSGLVILQSGAYLSWTDEKQHVSICSASALRPKGRMGGWVRDQSAGDGVIRLYPRPPLTREFVAVLSLLGGRGWGRHRKPCFGMMDNVTGAHNPTTPATMLSVQLLVCLAVLGLASPGLLLSDATRPLSLTSGVYCTTNDTSTCPGSRKTRGISHLPAGGME